MSKRALLAATAMLFISTAAASAIEINCGAPRVALGDEPDSNPVVSVDIRYIPEDHAWRIFHNRRDGLVVSRSEQYAIQDASNDRKAQWQGSLNRQRNLYMIGEVRRGSDNGVFYHEWMYDRSRGNLLVMQSTARCAMAAPLLPQPTSQAAPPLPRPTAQTAPMRDQGEVTLSPPSRPTAPVFRVKDSVPIYPHGDGKSVKLDVLVGGLPLRALLDTGAQMCLISESVANRLLQDGNASMKYTDRNERFVMADGSVSSLPVILIHEMRIGSHVVRNVRAAVTAAGGMIVAFPVVNDIAPFTIDTRAGELIFHTTANS